MKWGYSLRLFGGKKNANPNIKLLGNMIKKNNRLTLDATDFL
jgi:hypothetical protein